MNTTAHRTEERKRIMLENHRLDLYNNGGSPHVKKEISSENFETMTQSPTHTDSLERMKKQDTSSILIEGKTYHYRIHPKPGQKPR